MCVCDIYVYVCICTHRQIYVYKETIHIYVCVYLLYIHTYIHTHTCIHICTEGSSPNYLSLDYLLIYFT